LNRYFKKRELAKLARSTVHKPRSILSTVNNTVYDVLPEIGRKSKRNITFSKKVCHDDSSEGTLFTFKEDKDMTPAKAESRKAQSPPPPMGGAGHFLLISKSGDRERSTEDTDFPYRRFLQARDIKSQTEKGTEKLEIKKEGFSTPRNEKEEVYKAELKLDTPNAIRARLPDRTKIMCLIDTRATEH
jgi:hypothetical protein